VQHGARAGQITRPQKVQYRKRRALAARQGPGGPLTMGDLLDRTGLGDAEGISRVLLGISVAKSTRRSGRPLLCDRGVGNICRLTLKPTGAQPNRLFLHPIRKRLCREYASYYQTGIRGCSCKHLPGLDGRTKIAAAIVDSGCRRGARWPLRSGYSLSMQP